MSHHDPLRELTALAAQLPPLPRQVTAAVYAIFLNGVRQVKGEAGAIGVLFDFAPPISRIVCRTLPISDLRTSYSSKQIESWKVQISILEERAKAQALHRTPSGILLSTSPETIVFDGPWQANHNSPDELIERQLLIRTGFFKAAPKEKNRKAIAKNTGTGDPLTALLKQRFGMVDLVESDPNWQVWHGGNDIIGILDPEHCNAAEILQAAIRLDEISDTNKKSLLVVCPNADTMMHNQQLIDRLSKFDTSLLAADSRKKLLEQLSGKKPSN